MIVNSFKHYCKLPIGNTRSLGGFMGIFSPRDLLFTMNRIIQFKYEEPW
mgnify:CR=1 FL=1|jgi:hypothetical protein